MAWNPADADDLDPESDRCFRLIADVIADVILRRWSRAQADADQLAAALKDAERANTTS